MLCFVLFLFFSVENLHGMPSIHIYYVDFAYLSASWCQLSKIAQMSCNILQLFMDDPEVREDIYSLQHIMGLPLGLLFHFPQGGQMFLLSTVLN